jgi:hypothetical protein
VRPTPCGPAGALYLRDSVSISRELERRIPTGPVGRELATLVVYELVEEA